MMVLNCFVPSPRLREEGQGEGAREFPNGKT